VYLCRSFATLTRVGARGVVVQHIMKVGEGVKLCNEVGGQGCSCEMLHNIMRLWKGGGVVQQQWGRGV
jgi:hypothetical protein